jgi:mono/diheme cytochrome c family protein
VSDGPGDCLMIRRFALLAAFVVAAACAHAPEPSAPVAEGRRVFQDQDCYICHTIGKTGWRFGPDLSHIGGTHDRSYWIGWLRDPASQKSTAHMSKLSLTDAEVEALADYLGSLQ